jgi:alkylation response protein AidB-like acyl-CoA dehydrogenase
MTTAPEVLEIRNLAREFARSELRPHTEEWDAHGSFGDALPAKIAELGFFGMLLPEDAAGMGFDLVTYTAALEELAWGESGAALLVAENVIAADIIARSGNDALREQWLPRLASGEATACFAETGAARITGDRITGSARFVVNGVRAQVCIVSSGAGVYVAEGFTAATPAAPLGLRTIGVADLMFDGTATAVNVENADTATAALSIAAIATGIAQAALEHALRYSGEREQFGTPIRAFEGIQSKLAEMATRIGAARALLERAAAEPSSVSAVAMAKLSAATCAMFVTTEAVQIFGGYGYMRDYPVEKLMRDAKAMELLHGSNETQRARIAEALFA